jgi:plasmid stability protein
MVHLPQKGRENPCVTAAARAFYRSDEASCVPGQSHAVAREVARVDEPKKVKVGIQVRDDEGGRLPREWLWAEAAGRSGRRSGRPRCPVSRRLTRRGDLARCPISGTCVSAPLARQNDTMPSVQIKDVPEETHAVLRRRAAAAHQSLQEYLRSKLIDDAARPTVDEVLDRASGRAGGSVPLKTAAQAVRDDRAGR